MNNYRRFFFLGILVVLLVGLGTVSAGNITDDTAHAVHEDVAGTDITGSSQNPVSEDNNKNIKTDTVKTVKSDDENTPLTINSSNYNDYFELDATDNLYYSKGYEYLPSNHDITIEDIKGRFSEIKVDSNSSLTIRNIDTSMTRLYLGDNVTFKNSEFTVNGESSIEELGSNCTFSNVTIKGEMPEVPVNEFDILGVSSDNFTLINSQILVNMATNTISWMGVYRPQTVPVVITGHNARILNNNITVHCNSYQGDYSTCYGFYITGDNTTVTDNNIILTNGENPGWLYAFEITSSNNNITGNNISVQSLNYTAGIYFDSATFQNNTIHNNTINLTNGYNGYGLGALNEHVGYAITLTNRAYMGATYKAGTGRVINNNVTGNLIICNGYSSYGIEQFGGDYTLIANNTFIQNGVTPLAIGVIGVHTNITGNTITVNGRDNNSYNSADYIKGTATGITLQRGSDNYAYNNTIRCPSNAGIIIESEDNDSIYNNTVNSKNNIYSVILDSQTANTTVKDNNLRASTRHGDNSIENSGQNNKIINNTSPQIKETKITVNTNNARTGEDLIINGILRDTENNTISNATLTLNINDIQVNTTTDNNGQYICIYTTHEAGNMTINATFNGNDEYQASSIQTIVNINKIETIITANNMTAQLGSTVTLNTTIKDSNGNNITNGRVGIKINGKTFGYSNITNGKIRFNINLSPESFGKYNYKVLFIYGGSNTHKETRQNTTLTITAFNPVFDVKITNATSVRNTAVMTVKISNGTGYNARSGTVGFKINGKTYKINGKAYTVKIKNGTATFKFNITKDMAGTKSITVTYSGNSQFNQNRTTIHNAITIKNKVTATTTNVKTIIGENAVLRARFIGTDGKAITSGKVAIKINGKTFGHTNITNGIITYTLKIDPKKFSARNYTVTFKYGGSNTYTQVTANTTLQITKHTPKFNYTTTTAHRNTTTRIILKITDDKNTVQADNGTVGMKINGKTYKINNKTYTVKPVNGTATFTVNTNNLKTNNNITFTYSGYREFNGLKQTYNSGLIIRT